MEKIGLIAGRGNFPVLFSQEAAHLGYSVIAIAVKGNTRGCLKKYADKLFWIEVTEFKDIAAKFKQEGVSKAAMAGQINPYFLFNPKIMSNPDVRDFFGKIEDRRADTIFNAFTTRLQEAGLELIDSTAFLAKYMPEEGILSQRKPTEEEGKDISFGFKIARHLGVMDIGQSVCVKNGVILAVESIEGTDNTIRRAKSYAGSSVVLVKTAKPNQDMRFDVPVVGLRTIRNLPRGSCLAFEAEKTLFLDQKDALRLADKKDITIVSRKLPIT